MRTTCKFFLAVFFGFAVSCSPRKADNSAREGQRDVTRVTITRQQFQTANIRFGKVTLRNVSGIIKANGTLDVPPQNLVTISAPLGGFVKSTELLQGMKVAKGQVVAVLEHPDYIQLQEDYLVNKNQLDFQLSDYHRQEELAKENVNAAKALQLSRSMYLGTKAKVEGLQAKLRLINLDPGVVEKDGIQPTIRLYCPISGFVTQVNVNLGMFVNPADVMFRIVDTEHLHAEAQVFEKDITKLRVGQTVRLTLSNDPHERLAKVYLIGREITADRTVRVHCHLEDEDSSLIPGMYFSASIETDPQAVPALPDPAIVTFEGKKYIFTAPDSSALRFDLLEVGTGVSESGYTELRLSGNVDTSGLLVVTNGAYDLLAALKNSEQ